MWFQNVAGSRKRKGPQTPRSEEHCNRDGVGVIFNRYATVESHKRAAKQSVVFARLQIEDCL